MAKTSENPEPRSEKVRQSYDGIAGDYDHIYGAEDYGSRCSLYRTLIDKHGAPGNHLVDLGCGTGRAALWFAEAGFRTTGVDYSQGMLGAAAAKPGASAVRFVPGDLRRLPELGPFDVAVMLGGPLNYLNDEHELRATLGGVFRLLRPGGLFVFDLYTQGLRDALLSGSHVFESADGLTVMRGYPAMPEHLMEVQVDHFSSADSSTWNRTTFRHPQFHFPLVIADRLLDAAGMTVLERYGLAFDHEEPLTATDDRDHKLILVVARKRISGPGQGR